MSYAHDQLSNDAAPRVGAVADTWAMACLLALWLPSLAWGWMVLNTAFALGLTLLVAGVLLRLCRAREDSRIPPPVSVQRCLVILLFSLAWCAFTGLPHVFTLNADWLARLEILNQFTVAHPWQRLDEPGGLSFLFRFPGAYYAIPALFATALGIDAVRILLWICTSLTCAIALLTLFRQFSWRRLAIALLALVLVNGFDLFGEAALVLGRGQALPAFGVHIEWWSLFQYSGLTTAMIWVPNHLLPALLFCALLLSQRAPAASMPHLLLLGMAALGTIFWSPLVFVGTLPLIAARSLDLLRTTRLRHIISGLPWGVVAAMLGVALASAWYITLETGAIRKGSYLSICETGALKCTGRLALFYLFEALPLAALCWCLPHRHLGCAAAATLLLLPLFAYGPNNDMLMRASLPALILATFSLAVLLQRPVSGMGKYAGYALLLAAGYSSAGELWRGLREIDQPRWQAIGFMTAFRKDFPHSLDNGYPNHYLIPLDKACGNRRSIILRGCPSP